MPIVQSNRSFKAFSKIFQCKHTHRTDEAHKHIINHIQDSRHEADSKPQKCVQSKFRVPTILLEHLAAQPILTLQH